MPRTRLRRRKLPKAPKPRLPALRAMVDAAVQLHVDRYANGTSRAEQQAAEALKQLRNQDAPPPWMLLQASATPSFTAARPQQASLPPTDAPELYPFI